MMDYRTKVVEEGVNKILNGATNPREAKTEIVAAVWRLQTMLETFLRLYDSCETPEQRKILMNIVREKKVFWGATEVVIQDIESGIITTESTKNSVDFVTDYLAKQLTLEK